MKKGLKKCLSIVLTIAMLVSVMSVSFVVNAAGDTVTINGTKYNVGDTIEVKKEITVNNKWLLDGQVTVPYDNTVLEFVQEDPKVMFPMIYNHALVWNDTGSEIKFNFLNISTGIDFTSGGVLYDFTFLVKAGSDQEIIMDDVLEVIDTFPYEGDPQDPENTGKPIYPWDSAIDENGNIPESIGTEGNVEVTIDTPALNTLVVNGYTAKVDEIIYISKKIKVDNNWIQNGQISITYDPELLEYKPDLSSNDKMFPAVTSNGSFIVYDTKDQDGNPLGEIRFNFTDIMNGYDFTTETILYDIPFRVKKGSDVETKVEDTIEAMSSYKFAGDPADQDDMGALVDMISVVDESTGEIAEGKGTSQAEPVVDKYPAVTDKIIVNGVEVVPGDIVNHYLDVQDDRWFVNGQYEITFDNTVLEYVNNDYSVTYPVISASGTAIFDNVIDNGDGTSTILVNYTTISGIDFSDGGRMFDYYFVVKEDAAPGRYTVGTNIIDTYVFTTPGGVDPSYDMTDVYNEATGELEVGSSDLITEIPVLNLDVLNALIAEAEAKAAETGYTQDSIDALNAELTAAKAVAADPKSQPQIDSAVEDLQAAIDGLVIDTAELEALIAQAEAIDTTGYTAESAQALADAITAAKAVKDNPESVQAVADAKDALQAAIDGLAIDTAELEALIAQAEAIDTTGYTAESVQALADAITAAKAVKDNPESVQAVADAKDALQAAIDGLAIDTAELEALIAQAEAIDTTGYTAESVQALADAITAAKAVKDNPESVQAVADAKDALQAAIDGLKADTEELEKAIAEAEAKLGEDKYSPASKAVLQAAVDAGKALIEKVAAEFVPYEDVLKATEDINAAIEALVEGVLLGDATGDGKVNIDDASWIQKFLAKLITEDNIVKLAADVNKDGKITVLDASMLQIRLAMNTPDEYVFPDEG